MTACCDRWESLCSCQCLGIPLKTLHAGAHLGHVGGNGKEIFVAGIEECLCGVVHAVVKVGFDPAGTWAIDGRIEKDDRLAGASNAVVDGFEVCRGLDDKAIDAQREHLIDVHELGLGVKVARANDRLVARGEHDLLHAIENEPRPFVGVIQNDDGDDVGLLSGERLRLGVGNVSKFLNDARDFVLRLLAKLFSFVVEVIRDACRRGSRLSSDVCDRNALFCHSDSFRQMSIFQHDDFESW